LTRHINIKVVGASRLVVALHSFHNNIHGGTTKLHGGGKEHPEGGTLADCSCLRNQVGALIYAFKAGFSFWDEIRRSKMEAPVDYLYGIISKHNNA
jgi:hypothetical protein